MLVFTQRCDALFFIRTFNFAAEAERSYIFCRFETEHRENIISIRSTNLIILLITWLAPRAGMMNQILRCDSLPDRARWSYLARSGLPAVSRKKNFPKSHIINPLLTKFVRSRWLDIGLVPFLLVHGPRLRLGPYTRKK